MQETRRIDYPTRACNYAGSADNESTCEHGQQRKLRIWLRQVKNPSSQNNCKTMFIRHRHTSTLLPHFPA